MTELAGSKPGFQRKKSAGGSLTRNQAMGVQSRYKALCGPVEVTVTAPAVTRPRPPAVAVQSLEAAADKILSSPKAAQLQRKQQRQDKRREDRETEVRRAVIQKQRDSKKRRKQAAKKARKPGKYISVCTRELGWHEIINPAWTEWNKTTMEDQ